MNICLVLLLCTIAHVTCENRARRQTASVAEQLRMLIQEESSLRARLESRVARLRVTASKINDTISKFNYTTQTLFTSADQLIAYTGTLPSYKTSEFASTVIKFTNDFVNIGTPYNVTSGHFVASVSGLYGFSITVECIQPSYWTTMQLVKNGSPILYVRTGGLTSGSISKEVKTATNFAVIELKRGDEVWPRYRSSSTFNVDGVSTFSGVLLHQM